ncbi:N-acetyltransferase family protein [Caenispirillum bisanense]|uniref:GNAT family N-acetyltransferase n=1 Tax=Caenispirillum bisanense TaxID=414052 RepID=UPI0031D6088F
MAASSPPSPDAAVRVRDAVAADMDAVQAIYAHHVRHGTGSYEYDPPDLAEMQARWQKIVAQGLPWLVAEDAGSGAVLGYAYAGLFHGRIGWRFVVEDSVYIHPDHTGRGLGEALLREVLERCEALGYRQMMGVVGDGANAGSIRLHEKLGFTRIGTAKDTGWKFGRWLDTVYMQKQLGPGGSEPPPG